MFPNRRKEEIRARKRSLNSLSPLRRTLFPTEADESPKYELISPDSPQTPSNTLKRLLEPPSLKRVNRSFDQYHTPSGHFASDLSECHDMLTPNILEKTFTVRSILKELHLEKYIDLFNMHEIDLFVFSQITSEEMAELGIDDCDREILLEAIEAYGVYDENDHYSTLDKRSM